MDALSLLIMPQAEVLARGSVHMQWRLTPNMDINAYIPECKSWVSSEYSDVRINVNNTQYYKSFSIMGNEVPSFTYVDASITVISAAGDGGGSASVIVNRGLPYPLYFSTGAASYIKTAVGTDYVATDHFVVTRTDSGPEGYMISIGFPSFDGPGSSWLVKNDAYIHVVVSAMCIRL